MASRRTDKIKKARKMTLPAVMVFKILSIELSFPTKLDSKLSGKNNIFTLFKDADYEKRETKFSQKFKTKVALEAVSGSQTLAEFSTKHEVHPAKVSTWKKTLTDIRFNAKGQYLSVLCFK